ncbi:hypothetical protein Pint_12163 [Pistacia integerrima]|uniref:Uncharacterized protein n=1 Tax=Pistacia integerrima TaxID=434235 RepID=A0ACC0XJM7_9ROSI|nr:hypothetical protein Pint_12163 [Pistacia integerrima]
MFDLRIVLISVPLPSLREAPSVRQFDGSGGCKEGDFGAVGRKVLVCEVLRMVYGGADGIKGVDD